MLSADRPDAHAAACRQALLQAVPVTARHILVVGDGKDDLASALKTQDPQRIVLAIEQASTAATRAAGSFDRVFTLDVENADPAIDTVIIKSARCAESAFVQNNAPVIQLLEHAGVSPPKTVHNGVSRST